MNLTLKGIISAINIHRQAMKLVSLFDDIYRLFLGFKAIAHTQKKKLSNVSELTNHSQTIRQSLKLKQP